uniref:Nuclear migration protein nudC n=1 Tax=Theileria annulata TaxID=5874 RepID=A0A3B0MUR5_THEAN
MTANFDEFMFMALKECKGIEDVLEKFFSFLRRRTDFCYTVLTPEQLKEFGLDNSVNSRGFRPNQMRDLVNKIIEDNFLVYRRTNQPYLLPSNCRSDSSTQNFSYDKTRPTNEAENRTPNPHKSDKKYTVNTWNGAITEKYAWSQTFRDVTLEILSPKKITTKDVSVLITKDRLSINLQGQVLIDGEFCNKVNSSDSFWSIEDGFRILLNIEKAEELWWDCVIKGHETIDTQEIESVKRLDEFSSSEQNAILKLIKDHKEKNKFQ